MYIKCRNSSSNSSLVIAIKPKLDTVNNFNNAIVLNYETFPPSTYRVEYFYSIYYNIFQDTKLSGTKVVSTSQFRPTSMLLFTITEL
jgi:hypothetical protein